MPEPETLYNTHTLIETHQADADFVHHMVSLFIKNIPQTNAKLIKACEEQDWEWVYFYAHKLKASIDLFNLEPLKTVIRNIETNTKNLSKVKKQAVEEDVRFISSYIQKCVAAMKKDFQLA